MKRPIIHEETCRNAWTVQNFTDLILVHPDPSFVYLIVVSERMEDFMSDLSPSMSTGLSPSVNSMRGESTPAVTPAITPAVSPHETELPYALPAVHDHGSVQFNDGDCAE